MTDTSEIARIRAALEELNKYDHWSEWWLSELHAACLPADMTAVMSHIDAQAAEIERLRADALRDTLLLTDALKVLKAHQEYGSPTLLTGVMAVNAIKAIESAMKEQP